MHSALTRRTTEALYSGISSGDNHTCAIASDDQADCWGGNFYGELGNGTTTHSPVPVKVNSP